MLSYDRVNVLKFYNHFKAEKQIFLKSFAFEPNGKSVKFVLFSPAVVKMSYSINIPDTNVHTDSGFRCNVRTESSLGDISEIMYGITRSCEREINKRENGTDNDSRWELSPEDL